MGLDVQHRQRLLDILGNMATRIPVVLVLRPQDELPSWATDVVSLKKMKIAWQGSPEEYQVRRERERQQKEKKSGKPIVKEHPPGDPVVQLEKVNVVYSGQKILDNISWTVRQGERWALLGPNGKETSEGLCLASRLLPAVIPLIINSAICRFRKDNLAVVLDR